MQLNKKKSHLQFTCLRRTSTQLLLGIIAISISLSSSFFFFSCEKKQKTREENHLMEDKKKKKQEEKKKKDAAQKKVSLRRVLLSDTCASFSFHLPLPAVYSKNPFRFKEFNVSSFVATKKKKCRPRQCMLPLPFSSADLRRNFCKAICAILNIRWCTTTSAAPRACSGVSAAVTSSRSHAY